MVCGMEVVLADGSLLRTGMGAMEGNPAWHTYKRGLGPVLDPLFMQSNLGIVTRMGIWLQRRPECYLPAAFKLWRDEDIDQGLEIVRDLMMDGVMDGVPNIFNTLISASVLATRSDWSTDPAPLDDRLIDRIAHDLDVGRWAGRFALYGDEDMVDLKLAKIRKAFSVIPSAQVVAERKFLRGEFAQITRSSDKIQFGIPDLEVDNITGWYNQAEGGHIGFSPVVPLKAQNIREVRTMLRTHLEQEAGLDFLVGLLTINERSVIMVTMVLFDTTDPEMTTRAYEACARTGAGGGPARLPGIPRAPVLHGPRAGAVRLRRPRLPPLLRDDQGRRRSQRDPLPGAPRDLAERDASVAGAKPWRALRCSVEVDAPRRLHPTLLVPLLAPSAARAGDAPRSPGDRCPSRQTGLDPASRGHRGVHRASMPASQGTARVWRSVFHLQQRTVDGGIWKKVAAPSFGRWERSRPGVAGFVYAKDVHGLTAPGDTARSCASGGTRPTAPSAETRRTTRSCKQPDQRPDLVGGRVQVLPAADGTAAYRVAVRNTGRTAAGPFAVALSVGGAPVASTTVGGLAPGAATTVELAGPACSAGQPVQLTIDEATRSTSPRRPARSSARSVRRAATEAHTTRLDWMDHEDRHPSRVRRVPRALYVWQRVHDALDPARDPRRDLLELPSVLHRQAADRRYGWPRRALQAARSQAPARHLNSDRLHMGDLAERRRRSSRSATHPSGARRSSRE